jgi:hypothetical protein
MGSLTFVIMLVVFFAVVNRGRRRWHRSWGYGPNQFPMRGGPWMGMGQPWEPQQVAAPPRNDLENYVDALEARVAQLEERLDFTERLLTGSKGPVDWRAQPVSREADETSAKDRGLKGDV